LAAKEIDYFVYLVWNSNSSAVNIAYSRYPGGSIYSDFSSSGVDAKYLAYNGATVPAASDVCQLIGRFAATLSAGAGYTYSVPAYTAANLINYPIYQTRWLDFNFASSNITIGNGVTNVSRYQIIFRTVSFYDKWTLGTTSAIPSSPVLTPPFAPATSQQTYDGPIGGGRFNDTGTANYLGAIIIAGTSIQPVAYTVGGTYAGMTGLTALIPFTWGSTDTLACQGSYEI
jgi:hypothetical protein